MLLQILPKHQITSIKLVLLPIETHQTLPLFKTTHPPINKQQTQTIFLPLQLIILWHRLVLFSEYGILPLQFCQINWSLAISLCIKFSSTEHLWCCEVAAIPSFHHTLFLQGLLNPPDSVLLLIPAQETKTPFCSQSYSILQTYTICRMAQVLQ